MLVRDWRIRIEDILGAIAKVQRYTETLSQDQFLEDEKTLDAAVRNMIVIGEAARHVPDEIMQRYPDIPWRRMQGLRNLAVHEYFGVDSAILWETIKRDLPPLLPHLRRILEESE